MSRKKISLSNVSNKNHEEWRQKRRAPKKANNKDFVTDAISLSSGDDLEAGHHALEDYKAACVRVQKNPVEVMLQFMEDMQAAYERNLGPTVSSNVTTGLFAMANEHLLAGAASAQNWTMENYKDRTMYMARTFAECMVILTAARWQAKETEAAKQTLVKLN